jgi:Fe2+ transport system protein FeoA
MKITRSDIGKIFHISEIIGDDFCQKCDSCLKMRLIEMGVLKNEKIQIVDYSLGLWRVDILDEDDMKYSSLAFRDEELSKICVL